MTLLDDLRRVEIETQARAEGMDLTRKELEPVIERLTAENERLRGAVETGIDALETWAVDNFGNLSRGVRMRIEQMRAAVQQTMPEK